MKNEIILYQTDELPTHIEVKVDEQNETIWLTQEQIAELYGTQRPAISKHLANIFRLGELDEKVVSSILEHTTQHGAMNSSAWYKMISFFILLKIRNFIDD
jgi:hypothetical protein